MSWWATMILHLTPVWWDCRAAPPEEAHVLPHKYGRAWPLMKSWSDRVLPNVATFLQRAPGQALNLQKCDTFSPTVPP